METFQRLLRHNLKLFSGTEFDYLVTACATCTSTIKKVWPLLASRKDGFDEDQVAAIAQKTIDISQLLEPRIELANREHTESDADIIITYHDPCHLKKSLGVTAEPRALITAASGYRLIEMAEADRCCGLGGSFNLQYYDLSTRIGRLKRDHIKASGCAVVATSCPACMLQIADMLSQAGEKIQVKHPVEIYRQSLP
jgi:glycolate oxidase iron-sulfur subunit